MTTEIWLAIIVILAAAIAYFLKRILDNTDKVVIDVSDMKPKVDLLWTEVFSNAHSPRQLNDAGDKILNESGIKEIVNEKRLKLLEIVKATKPLNPYDAEKTIMEVMANLHKHCPEIENNLKQGAFKSGVPIDVVLFVGGLYLRNLIFSDLGFSLTDLDKPKTTS